jgi:hypothetical protein
LSGGALTVCQLSAACQLSPRWAQAAAPDGGGYPLDASSYPYRGKLGSRCHMPQLWTIVAVGAVALLVGGVTVSRRPGAQLTNGQRPGAQLTTTPRPAACPPQGVVACRRRRPGRQGSASSLLLRKSLLGGSGELPGAVLATLDVPQRWQQVRVS